MFKTYELTMYKTEKSELPEVAAGLPGSSPRVGGSCARGDGSGFRGGGWVPPPLHCEEELILSVALQLIPDHSNKEYIHQGPRIRELQQGIVHTERKYVITKVY